MFLRFITAMAWAWGGAWALVLLAGFFYNCITGWSTKKLWSAVHLTSLAVPAWAWLAARYLKWLYEGDLGYGSQPAPHLVVTGVDYENKTVTFGAPPTNVTRTFTVHANSRIPRNSVVFLGYDGLWEFDGRQTVAINNLKPPEGY